MNGLPGRDDGCLLFRQVEHRQRRTCTHTHIYDIGPRLILQRRISPSSVYYSSYHRFAWLIGNAQASIEQHRSRIPESCDSESIFEELGFFFLRSRKIDSVLKSALSQCSIFTTGDSESIFVTRSNIPSFWLRLSSLPVYRGLTAVSLVSAVPSLLFATCVASGFFEKERTPAAGWPFPWHYFFWKFGRALITLKNHKNPIVRPVRACFRRSVDVSLPSSPPPPSLLADLDSKIGRFARFSSLAKIKIASFNFIWNIEIWKAKILDGPRKIHNRGLGSGLFVPLELSWYDRGAS